MGDEKPFDETQRDILVELRADMRHVRSSMDKFQQSDQKQWDKLDEHGATITGHDKSLDSLTWAFRLIAGGILTVISGVIIYVATH